MSLSFASKINLSIAGLSAALLLTAGFGWHRVGSLETAMEHATANTTRQIQLSGALYAAASGMSAGQRGVIVFAASKDSERSAQARDLFRRNRELMEKSLAAIRPMQANEEGKRITAEIERGVAAWMPLYGEIEQQASAGDAAAATKTLGEKIAPVFQTVSEQCERLIAINESLLEADRKDAAAQVDSAHWMLILNLVFGAVGITAGLLIVRSAMASLRRAAVELHDGSTNVASAAGQVASASQSLAQGTSEQAATLEETSASSAEITAVTRRNTENTRTVTSLMGTTGDLVEAANRSLGEMVHSMKEINGSGEKISKIIRVIDEIAFQTNILALNAAVEAARAGEAGMGFAVVADEVRNLAHRSAQAAKDTAALIEESIARSQEGSRKLEQVAGSIRQITGSTSEVKILVDEVDTGSQEQSRGIEQIVSAIGQMERVTQRNAANAEQSAAASEELAAQAKSLYTIVERVRQLAGDGGKAPGPGARAQVPAAVRAGKHPPVSVPSRAAQGQFPLNDQELF
jgi:methyl-accepting chemotaxis protein